jgi:MFS_1, major facilitator family
MEKLTRQPQIVQRGFPYFLLFTIYAVITAYLPITLKAIGFSTAQVGILLGIIEIVGVCAPFLVMQWLDKTGRYGFMMCIFGVDMALLLLPLLRFHSFFVTGVCLGIFAVGFKGMVPVLDGFTTKALGQYHNQYGKIRALGSAGFVGMNLFLQLHPLISGKNPLSIIMSVSAGALLFVITLRWVPDLYDFGLVQTDEKSNAGVYDRLDLLTVFPQVFWEYLSLIFLAFLGLVPCQRFFSLYVEEYIKVEASAGLWALSAMAEIPMLIISGKLIQRFGKGLLLVLCLLSIIVRNCCYIFIPGIAGAVVGQLLHSISFGLFHPLSVLLCVFHSHGNTVTAMTLFTAASGIAYVIGSMIGGYIIEYAGYPALFLLFSIFPAIGACFYFLTMRRKG